MIVGILVSTFWEARQFIRDFRMKRTGGATYRRDWRGGAVILRLSGMGQARAKRAAEEILEYSPSLVVSTGFAGALKEEIDAGDLVLDAGRSHSELINCLSGFSERTNIPLHHGTFWSDASIVTSSADKKKVGQNSGAIAIEMESQSVFSVCKDKKIPFLSVRAVSDPVNRSLPTMVTQLDSSGKIGIKFLLKLLGSPSQWGPLFHLIIASGKAEKSLSVFLIDFLKEFAHE